MVQSANTQANCWKLLLQFAMHKPKSCCPTVPSHPWGLQMKMVIYGWENVLNRDSQERSPCAFSMRGTSNSRIWEAKLQGVSRVYFLSLHSKPLGNSEAQMALAFLRLPHRGSPACVWSLPMVLQPGGPWGSGGWKWHTCKSGRTDTRANPTADHQ